MSRKFYFLLVAISALMLSSCRKEHGNENKSATLDVAINAGEMYQLALREYVSPGGNATITKQAGSYSTSRISRDASSGNYIYQFLKEGTPKIGGNGTDQVLLKVAEPGGRCNRGDETNITINFTIL